MPTAALIDFWEQMSLRKAREINQLNHSAAYLMAYKEAQGKQSTKMNHASWLPFSLPEPSSKDGKEQPKAPDSISFEVKARLIKLRNTNKLPQIMLRDLYRYNIISPGD